MRRAAVHAAVLAGVAAISWAGVLVALAEQPPLVAAWWRFTVAAAALTPAALASKSPPPPALLAAAAGALLAAHILLWFTSIPLCPVATSTALVDAYPLWLALTELAQHQAPPRRVVGAAIALAGLALLSTRSGGGCTPTGAALAVAGSIAAAAYFHLGAAARRRGAGAAAYTAAAYAAGAAILTAACAATKHNPLAVPPSAAPYLILLGLLPAAVGHTAMNYALKHLPPSIVTAYILLEPYMTAAWAYIALHQAPPPLAAAGLPLTTTGLALILTTELQK